MNEIGVGQIASISGRYYAMDRDKRMDRIELAYNALIGKSGETYSDPVQYVKDSYAKEVYDEFVIPGYNPDTNGAIEDNDAIIFANFRPDRAIQMSNVFTADVYDNFKPADKPKNIHFVCMMRYADTVNGDIAFHSLDLSNTLGDYLSAQGLKQLRIAETEKYAHVTFFMDGGVDKEIEGATRVLINSPKVATYDLQPEMSAYEVKDKLIEELDKDIHDVVIVNFANCDMVGHTGNFEATVIGVESVDLQLARVKKAVDAVNGILIVTADHGNADEMYEKKKKEDAPVKAKTSHTLNKVPFIIYGADVELKQDEQLGLSNVAATVADLLEVAPNEHWNESIIKK